MQDSSKRGCETMECPCGTTCQDQADGTGECTACTALGWAWIGLGWVDRWVCAAFGWAGSAASCSGLWPLLLIPRPILIDFLTLGLHHSTNLPLVIILLFFDLAASLRTCGPLPSMYRNLKFPCFGSFCQKIVHIFARTTIWALQRLKMQKPCA